MIMVETTTSGILRKEVREAFKNGGSSFVT